MAIISNDFLFILIVQVQVFFGIGSDSGGTGVSLVDISDIDLENTTDSTLSSAEIEKSLLIFREKKVVCEFIDLLSFEEPSTIFTACAKKMPSPQSAPFI